MSARLEEALVHHRAGRLAEAEQIYEEVLRAEPENADAWQFLGLVALHRGDAAGAVARIERAVALNPADGVCHFNLGLARRRGGDLAGAIASYRDAIKRSPGLAEAHNNLGNCLRESGDAERAVVACRQAIALKPTDAEAHLSLSRALYDLGRLEAAEATARRSVSLNTGSAMAHFQLGNALQARRQFAEAEAAYRAAFDLDPGMDGVNVNLGNVFGAQRNYEAAIQAYRRAIDADPGNLQAHFGLIRTWFHLGRHEEAFKAVEATPPGGPKEAQDFAEIFLQVGMALLESRRPLEAAEWLVKAVGLSPNLTLARYNLALACQNQGRLNEAIGHYGQALKIDPAMIEARKNLAVLHMALGRPADAIAVYRDGMRECPEVSDFQRLLVAATLYDPVWGNEDRYAEARRYADLYAANIRRARVPSEHVNSRDAERRLRVAYLSSDLHEHPVSRNLEPLLTHHDRSRFEILAYADVRRPDAMTARLQGMAETWRSIVGRTDEEVAAQLRADGVDILVSLAGHLDANRPLVAVYRPAPVQMSFHDVSTSGLEENDYLIADRTVCPANGTERFSERRVIRLPSIYAHQPIAAAPAVGPLPCARTGAVTFGCFNNPTKLNGAVLALWGAVLNSVPGSRLAVKFRSWFRSADLQARLVAAFASIGVEAGRLEFLGAENSLAVHLEAYNHVDIALDTYPFAGSTTTFEALWMGVPVVTLMGTNQMSRWSASMLKVVGLEELVTETPDRYITAAAELAGDWERLADLRSGLRARVLQSALVDGRLRARQIERVYRAVWRRWCMSGSRL